MQEGSFSTFSSLNAYTHLGISNNLISKFITSSFYYSFILLYLHRKKAARAHREKSFFSVMIIVTHFSLPSTAINMFFALITVNEFQLIFILSLSLSRIIFRVFRITSTQQKMEKGRQSNQIQNNPVFFLLCKEKSVYLSLSCLLILITRIYQSRKPITSLYLEN